MSSARTKIALIVALVLLLAVGAGLVATWQFVRHRQSASDLQGFWEGTVSVRTMTLRLLLNAGLIFFLWSAGAGGAVGAFEFNWKIRWALLPETKLTVARIAARHGSRRDGDLAMGLFAGYAIGQGLANVTLPRLDLPCRH